MGVAKYGSPLMAEEEAPPFTCERCGAWPMRLVGTIPRVGTLPELRSYRCDYCGHVDTQKHDED